MKTVITCRRGLTLLEIILSLALLGIIVVAFLGVFTSGFVTIVTMGNKSRAAVEAQTILDRVYSEAVFDHTEVSGKEDLRAYVALILDEIAPSKYEDYTDKPLLFQEANESAIRVRFLVSPPVALLAYNSVYAVSVQVYYQNYSRSVILSSPIVR